MKSDRRRCAGRASAALSSSAFAPAVSLVLEIIEWCGWALATWTWAGAAFAFFTIANLLPRALSHHRWYREKFPDYPRERKAILPGLL